MMYTVRSEILRCTKKDLSFSYPFAIWSHFFQIPKDKCPVSSFLESFHQRYLVAIAGEWSCYNIKKTLTAATSSVRVLVFTLFESDIFCVSFETHFKIHHKVESCYHLVGLNAVMPFVVTRLYFLHNKVLGRTPQQSIRKNHSTELLC
jgi:hypothetical protein